MDVKRLAAPTSWQMLMEQVDYVKKNPSICRTLVIDTADWAEKLAKDDVIAAGGEKVKSIEDYGYGKGYTFLSERWGTLLNRLQDVIDAGVNVVITAHAMMRKFEQPDEIGAYDRWELKLEKKTAPMTKEWADMILFANYKIFVVETKEKSKKAQGGSRVMYTQHHPAWDAKNRHGLAEELPFDFSSIAAHIPNGLGPVEAKPEKSTTQPEPTRKTDMSDLIEKAKGPAPTIQTSDRNIPMPLADLISAYEFTTEDVEKAIGPKTEGGIGYVPSGTKIEALETMMPGFTDYIIANWHNEFVAQIRHNKLQDTESMPFEVK